MYPDLRDLMDADNGDDDLAGYEPDDPKGWASYDWDLRPGPGARQVIPPPDALIDAVCPSCHCLDARVLGQLGPLVWVRCRACGDDYPLSTSQFTDDPECLVII